MGQLTDTLSKYWEKIQGSLFSWLEEELDPLTEKQQQLIAILELVRIEEFRFILFEETRPLRARVFQKRTIWEGCEAPPKSPITIPGLKARVHIAQKFSIYEQK